MSIARNRDDYFTYGDYLAWPEDERWELIDGRAYAMTPAPTTRHQRLVVILAHLLETFFENRQCKVYAAPDVRLPKGNEADEAIDTVVQPDLLVVCDAAKVDEKGIRGAPDLVIEILSQSTSDRDLGTKLFLYQKHGVRCYLIVDPWGKTITIRYLDPDGLYAHPEIYVGKDRMPIRIFDGLDLDLSRVFAE